MGALSYTSTYEGKTRAMVGLSKTLRPTYMSMYTKNPIDRGPHVPDSPQHVRELDPLRYRKGRRDTDRWDETRLQAELRDKGDPDNCPWKFLGGQ